MADGLYHKETPCHGCEERHENCHASCAKYIEFKDKSRKAYYAALLRKKGEKLKEGSYGGV